MLVTIVCDHCGFEVSEQNVYAWIDVKCPNCRQSYPILRQDLKYFRLISTMVKISNIIKFLFPWIKTKTVYVSSKRPGIEND